MARVVLAAGLFLTALFWVGGALSVLFYVLAVVMFGTACSGFCALYRLVGVNTCKKPVEVSKVTLGLFAAMIILILVGGGYASNFFTKKFFIEDFNVMNNFYKQTLFNTGQNKRAESIENYDNLVSELAVFQKKYKNYRPYAILGDGQFNADLETVSVKVAELNETIKTGDLPSAHIGLESVRQIFQDILKRNNFSLLAVTLVDFHDAMEVIIAEADAQNSQGIIEAYQMVSEKLVAVETEANDTEIQAIRQNLNALLDLAKAGKTEELSAKAGELKSSFVKVYLKRG